MSGKTRSGIEARQGGPLIRRPQSARPLQDRNAVALYRRRTGARKSPIHPNPQRTLQENRLPSTFNLLIPLRYTS